ncbi:MAG: branched-chain amino acid ABC transporter substrate-binding protein [Burkholderiales bacterium]|nr:branched-chain amino acid ABC transporter substrate-binding protein [Burkholderiales bacterium]
MIRTSLRGLRTLLVAFIAALPTLAAGADPVRIAILEPLTGPFANTGTTAVRAFQMELERLNATGGALGTAFELVPFDNKSSPQEATLQVQAAIDQGIRYIVQGSGSNVGHAISDAVARHNSRNPERTVLYLNHGALDPALTDDKCHFWHFRFVAHGHMIMQAVTDSIARQPGITAVYLINQDYAWGHAVARDARSMLAAKRPDIRVVGEDLHQIGKVKDFAPYVAKIKAAGANAIVSGNWGNDLSLLIRTIKDAGLSIAVYAPIAGLQGTPATIGDAGPVRVRAALFWHPNLPPSPLLDHALAFKARFSEDWNWLPTHLAPEMLRRAMIKADSVDPVKVARALEGLEYGGPTGKVWIRADDHQLMMPIYSTIFTKAGEPGVRFDAEGSGFGWKTEQMLAASENVPPLKCRVKRP